MKRPTTTAAKKFAALALLAVAHRIRRTVRRLDPSLPTDGNVYVSNDLWCHLPKHHRIVLSRNEWPEDARTVTRLPFITVAITASYDDSLDILVLRNDRETPYAMYGRDDGGIPLDLDEDGHFTKGTDAHVADMEALIRTAREAKNSTTLN